MLKGNVNGRVAVLGNRVCSFVVDVRPVTAHVEVINEMIDRLLDKLYSMGFESPELAMVSHAAVPVQMQAFALSSPDPRALGIRLHVMISYLCSVGPVPPFEWPWEQEGGGGSRVS